MMIRLLDLITLAGVSLADYKIHCATGFNPTPLEAFFDGKFKQWQESHQPFHWWIEFYGIMKGGFDVIIGNPPYVEWSRVKAYELLTNLYKLNLYLTLQRNVNGI